LLAGSGGDDAEDGFEGVGACQSSGVDGCAHVGFGVCSPFRAIAVGAFALDNTGPQRPLAHVIGGIDFSRVVAEREQLIARAPDLPEQLMRQFAVSGGGEDGIEVAQQLAPSVFHCRGSERCDVAPKLEGSVQP